MAKSPHFYGDSFYRGKEQRDRRKSSVRSKVDHPFLVPKRLWGFAKLRYRGMANNANRAFAGLAMLNISKWERSLTGAMRPA